MKLKLKAYKCAFPNLYTDAYNMYVWQDPKQFETIWGTSQKDAVKKRCINDEFVAYWELKSNINTRRYKEKDIYSQDRSILLEKITNKQIIHLTHSLGVEVGDMIPKEFYRNYSMYYEKNPDCEELCELGLMENWQNLGSEIYSVTEVGIKAIKTLLLCTKQ